MIHAQFFGLLNAWRRCGDSSPPLRRRGQRNSYPGHLEKTCPDSRLHVFTSFSTETLEADPGHAMRPSMHHAYILHVALKPRIPGVVRLLRCLGPKSPKLNATDRQLKRRHQLINCGLNVPDALFSFHREPCVSMDTIFALGALRLPPCTRDSMVILSFHVPHLRDDTRCRNARFMSRIEDQPWEHGPANVAVFRRLVLAIEL